MMNEHMTSWIMIVFAGGLVGQTSTHAEQRVLDEVYAMLERSSQSHFHHEWLAALDSVDLGVL